MVRPRAHVRVLDTVRAGHGRSDGGQFLQVWPHRGGLPRQGGRYRLAEASRAAAFEYVALPWGVLWGYLVFDTPPDLIALAGAMVLIATGIYTLRQGQAVEPSEMAIASPRRV